MSLVFSYCSVHAGDTIKHCLTPELAKLKPYPDPMARPCKEILNFPPRLHILKPYLVS